MIGAYSPGLVVLSVVIAILASYVALDLAGRIAAAEGRAVFIWLVGGAAAMGTGIWSMHFIGMLAFHLPIPMAYDPWITSASMLIAILASGFALYTASHRTLTWHRLAIAGTVMGIGIATMHYTGMAALQIRPGISYDLPRFAASIAIAIAASCVALWLASHLRFETLPYPVWTKLGSAAIMGLAIAGMHYTGMSAADFAANTICTAPADKVNEVWLATAIGGCAVLFLAATMGLAAFDAARALRLAIANEKIAKLAQTDTLTMLANRRGFHINLIQMFAAIERGGNPFALLYLDLDKFKDVNDTLGHPVGDMLLVEIADRLRNSVRESDIVARIGGDEFAILQTNTSDTAATGALAVKIGRLVAAPYKIGGHEVNIGVSIGISPYDTEIKKPEAMMMRADLALYRAKKEGRNGFCFFSEELDKEVLARIKLGEELRGAHERDELELYYMPEVEIATRRIIAIEALIRWNHPRRGLVMPSDFISVAERSGGIEPLGQWVLNDACRQYRLWLDQGIAPPILAVNISAAQFRRASDFQRDIAALLATWRIAPENVEFEFTEETLAEVAAKHDKVLQQLRQLGLKIAIDDFGLGHSSLDYLARNPPNRLKIAQKLVSDVAAEPRNAGVVRAAIGVAHALGIEVVAEGVESEAQMRFLIAAGCAHAQGYYYGRPMPAEETTELLRRKLAPRRRIA